MDTCEQFRGTKFSIWRELYLCRDTVPSVTSDAILIIREADGSWSTLSHSRTSSKCIGPYDALVFDPVGAETIGFLYCISSTLARANIPILAYSSFDRDYVLVPSTMLSRAVKALTEAGFVYVDREP